MAFGLGGSPQNGMLSMLAGMLGVTPEQIQKSVSEIQGILLGTAADMREIKGMQRASLENQRAIMRALNIEGEFHDYHSDRGSSAPAIGAPGNPG